MEMYSVKVLDLLLMIANLWAKAVKFVSVGNVNLLYSVYVSLCGHAF